MNDKAGESKKIICERCEQEFEVRLRIGEQELLDGWHGECPKPLCFTYFEAYPPAKKKNETIKVVFDDLQKRVDALEDRVRVLEDGKEKFNWTKTYD